MAGAARDTHVEDLDRLVARGLEANMKIRRALAATLFSRAETLAMQLHDDTCLVPAWLCFYRAASLRTILHLTLRVQVLRRLRGGVVLLCGAPGAALEGAQAHLPGTDGRRVIGRSHVGINKTIDHAMDRCYVLHALVMLQRMPRILAASFAGTMTVAPHRRMAQRAAHPLNTLFVVTEQSVRKCDLLVDSLRRERCAAMLTRRPPTATPAPRAARWTALRSFSTPRATSRSVPPPDDNGGAPPPPKLDVAAALTLLGLSGSPSGDAVVAAKRRALQGADAAHAAKARRDTAAARVARAARVVWLAWWLVTRATRCDWDSLASRPTFARRPHSDALRPPPLAQVDAAYDVLLSASLSRRKAGQVSTAVRWADAAPAPKAAPKAASPLGGLSPRSSASFSQSQASGGGLSLSVPPSVSAAAKRATTFLRTAAPRLTSLPPSAESLAAPAAVWALLSLTILFSGGLNGAPHAGGAHADSPPALQLGAAVLGGLYALRSRGVSPPRAAGLVAAAAAAGAALGTAVESLLRVDIVPLGPLSSPAAVVGEAVLTSIAAAAVLLA